MKQQFKRGSRVRMLKKPNFAGPSEYYGRDAIAWSSSAQDKGSSNTPRDYTTYILVVLDKRGHPADMCSWFDDDELELVGGNYMAGHDLMNEFFACGRPHAMR